MQVLIGNTGFSVAVNRTAFGDGTGGANAHTETTSHRFAQRQATPAQGATLGSLKGIYRVERLR